MMVRNIFLLLSCNYVVDERDTLFELINKSCKNFNNFDSDNKLTWLMTYENVQTLVRQ